jgi:hypothetical protein
VVKSVLGDQKNIENTEVFLKAIPAIPPEEYDKLVIGGYENAGKETSRDKGGGGGI